jgi:hypothetical protein
MFKFISKLVSSITLSRVFMWVLAISACIVFYTIYENRSRIFDLVGDNTITNPVGLTFSVGSFTQEQIRNQVQTDRIILGISVMSADLRLNEARSIFFAGDDAILTQIDADARKSGANRLPLFTNIDDSNADVIRLINGQFTCSKFDTTLLSRINPELKASVKMVCNSSIPSYYGYFSGFIVFFLGENLSPERQSQLKLVADKLATDVYFRDVIPTQKQERAAEGKIPFSPRQP